VERWRLDDPDVAEHAMSPTIDEIVIGDPPDAWRQAGFTVDPDGECRLGSVRVRLVGRDRGPRILRWSLRDLAPGIVDSGPDLGLIDGLPTAPSQAPPAQPTTHLNGTIAIDHVVLATPDNDRTIAAFDAAGFDVRRTRHTNSNGAPMRQTFFRAGPVILELVGPEEPSGDGPAGFFGLALTVADLEATAAYLADKIGTRQDAVQPGRRIATLRHRDLGMSVAIALMSPEPI
jgi:hypothetical protein